MSLQRRREKLIITHVWKVKQNIYPNSVNINFKLYKRTNSIKAVLKPLSNIKGRLLTAYEESFIIKACKLWNTLPGRLTHIDSLGSFKTELNKYMVKIPDRPPLPGYPYLNNNSLTEQCL